MIYAIVVIVIVFLLNVQYSAGMGNVWIRDGRICPGNALRIAAFPLRERAMWHPQFWDLNLPLQLLILTLWNCS